MNGFEVRQQRLRRIFRIFIVVYYIATLAANVYVVGKIGFPVDVILMAAAALLLPLLPRFLYRLFRIPPLYLAEMVFDTFLFAAATFASQLGGYELVPFFDKLLHFISGFLFALLGLLLYYGLKPGHTLEKTDCSLAALTALLTAIALGAVWEFYEFAASSVTGGAYDPQLVRTTGISDTMWDMLVCTVGGLITAYFCRRYYRTGKKDLMLAMFEEVYQIAFRPKQK